MCGRAVGQQRLPRALCSLPQAVVVFTRHLEGLAYANMQLQVVCMPADQLLQVGLLSTCPAAGADRAPRSMKHHGLSMGSCCSATFFLGWSVTADPRKGFCHGCPAMFWTVQDDQKCVSKVLPSTSAFKLRVSATLPLFGAVKACCGTRMLTCLHNIR